MDWGLFVFVHSIWRYATLEPSPYMRSMHLSLSFLSLSLSFSSWTKSKLNLIGTLQMISRYVLLEAPFCSLCVDGSLLRCSPVFCGLNGLSSFRLVLSLIHIWMLMYVFLSIHFCVSSNGHSCFPLVHPYTCYPNQWWGQAWTPVCNTLFYLLPS